MEKEECHSPESKFKEPYKTNGIKICTLVAKRPAPKTEQHAKKRKKSVEETRFKVLHPVHMPNMHQGHSLSCSLEHSIAWSSEI